MTWNRWYALRSYLRSALWVAPVIALALQQLTFRTMYVLDVDFGWIPGFVFNKAGTVAAMENIIAMTISFIVFTFGSLLVAAQIAGGQLTPRIIATTLLPDNVIRFTVGLFVYSLLLATAVKTRVDTIPDFLASLAGLLGIVSVVAFLFLIDYAIRLLRPVSIVWRIGEQGLKVIEDVYPNPIADAHQPARSPQGLGPSERIVKHRGKSAIVIAVNLAALVAAAKRLDGVIEFVPRVGDFVATGEPLFLLRGGASAIDDRMLRGQVAFGRERTIEQDSTFAFRVIVDIAIKALSKAINDPTTAVLAIDQLQRLLRAVGKRHLLSEEILDDEGRLRVVFQTPNWEDFVSLAFTEIRQYGAENVQVARRLRAVVEILTHGLRESRQLALREQLDLLDSTLERLPLLPKDLALARIPDLQGLGGASSR